MSSQLEAVVLQSLAQFIGGWTLLFGLYVLVLWVIHSVEASRHRRVMQQLDHTAAASVLRINAAYLVAQQHLRDACDGAGHERR